jgi:D-alanyl-D-alanine carboxypeptidase
MALFRYDTRCGTVYGHTGSILGYTQFIAASRRGDRAVAFTISSQVASDLLPELRAAEESAVCAALNGR